MNNFYKRKADFFVLAFIPYKLTADGIDSPHYDTQEYRNELNDWFQGLGLKWEWVEITLENYREKVQYAKELQNRTKLLVFNFCDGSEVDSFPGISIVVELERHNIPFTGASSYFYEVTTPKIMTKMILLENNIPTAPFVKIIHPQEDIKKAERFVGYPFILKPDISAANAGIYLKSVVYDYDNGVNVAEELLKEQESRKGIQANGIFAETFVIGKEYTVLVVGNYDRPDDLKIYKPIQRVFNECLPEKEKFLTFHRYWDHYTDEANIQLEPFAKDINEYYHYEPADSSIEEELVQLTREAFCALKGTGYARVDFRYDTTSGKLYILEVNSNCGLSQELSSSVGNILHLSDESFSEFLENIMNIAFMKVAQI